MDQAQTRRRFVQGLGITGLGLLVGCGTLSAPTLPRLPFQSTKPRPIGYLAVGAPLPDGARRFADEFQEALREHGWADHENVLIHYRFAEWNADRLRELAAELVALPVDVIVAADSEAITAARAATSTVPIVMAVAGDVVGQGIVTSLARPGGNITGQTNLSRELSGKRLEFLKEAAPGITRVAVLLNPAAATARLQWEDTQAAARALGVRVDSFEVRAPEDIDTAFATMLVEHHDGVIVLPDPLTNTHRRRITELAAQHTLPAMYGVRAFVDAGGLMAYGPNSLAFYRRAAYFVDRILRGTPPSQLPVEQPTRFELILNRTTAEALGITLPAELVLSATDMIR